MSDPVWATELAAVAAAVSAIATVVVAAVGWRISSAQEKSQIARENAKREEQAARERQQDQAAARRHQRSVAARVREQQQEWGGNLRRSVQEMLGDTTYDSLTQPAAVRILQSEGIDTAAIEDQDHIARGHLTLVRVYSVDNPSWEVELDQETGPTADTVMGLMDGSLDIVKDDLFGIDDIEWLKSGFNSELDAPELLGMTTQQILASQQNPDHYVQASLQRWLIPDAPSDVRRKAAALLRYKVQMEHALALAFVGQFVNVSTALSRGKRFRLALANLTAVVDDDMTRLIKRQIDLLQ